MSQAAECGPSLCQVAICGPSLCPIWGGGWQCGPSLCQRAKYGPSLYPIREGGGNVIQRCVWLSNVAHRCVPWGWQCGLSLCPMGEGVAMWPIVMSGVGVGCKIVHRYVPWGGRAQFGPSLRQIGALITMFMRLRFVCVFLIHIKTKGGKEYIKKRKKSSYRRTEKEPGIYLYVATYRPLSAQSRRPFTNHSLIFYNPHITSWSTSHRIHKNTS